MVSNRRFFSIVLMMAVILFMFQFSQVIREEISDYDTNAYAEQNIISGENRWEQGEKTTESSALAEEQGRGEILLFGREEYDTTGIVRQWCTYTKRRLTIRESLLGYSPDKQHMPEYILIDSGAVDYERDIETLVSCAEEGIHIIFLNLPEPSVIENNQNLKKLLGIQYVRASQVEVEGIHLFGDFLLGGSYIYKPLREEDEKRQDLNLEMPWYVTLDGTKTYMVGMLDELLKEDEAKNEYFPPVIWRNSFGEARIFAVNGDYMSDLMGLGILDAMVYETNSYEIHPVINAQNLLIVDFPGFAEENTEAMEKVYSRTPAAVQQEIIWPALLGLGRKGGWKLTCFLSPQYEYMDGAEPAADDFIFYLKQFREVEAEAAISLKHKENISLEEKAERDRIFYQETDSPYRYSAVCMAREEIAKYDMLQETYMEGVRTIAFSWNNDGDVPLVSYLNDMVTMQGITGDTEMHTYSEDIQLRGIQTALGYSNIEIDIQKVMWPDSEDFHWERFYERVSSNTDTFFKPFAAFEKTTLTESDRRLRLFLNLDYDNRREGDHVYLDVKNMGEESWFLLRTHGEEVVEAKGAEAERVEEGVYLMHVLDSQVDIQLKKSSEELTYILSDME